MSVAAIIAPNITITESALAHFSHLIENEDVQGMGLRIFIDQPGSPKADVSISFCPPGEHRPGDIPLPIGNFVLYVERTSVNYLEDAEIDYKKDNLGGQLAISAPNLRDKPSLESNLSDRVNYLLQTEINPNLASHGGMVSLEEITSKNEVILRFGGGCHGCGMVDVTLKQGIEKTLISQIPEITAVRDVTDHSQGENPYYA